MNHKVEDWQGRRSKEREVKKLKSKNLFDFTVTISFKIWQFPGT
jgi:hypothetical protein